MHVSSHISELYVVDQGTIYTPKFLVHPKNIRPPSRGVSKHLYPLELGVIIMACKIEHAVVSRNLLDKHFVLQLTYLF